MKSVRISRKTAQAASLAIEFCKPHGLDWGFALQELRAALKPKTLKPLKRASSIQKKAKRETRKEETARIRAEVFRRAEGFCEMCRACPPFELHHALGRVRMRQHETNCLALCGICHRHITLNIPSAAHWLERQATVFDGLGCIVAAGKLRQRFNSLREVSAASVLMGVTR